MALVTKFVNEKRSAFEPSGPSACMELIWVSVALSN